VTLPAESVSVELPPAVTAPGLKDAVAPEGSPLAESVTVSADPLMAAVEIVDVALPPCTAETLLGLALIEKSLGAGVTVSVTVVVCVALGAVPVTVTEYVPGVVAGSTVNVRVELEPAVIGFGLNEAVVPVGTPVAESVRLSGEPLRIEVAMVDAALPPCAADTLLGLAPIVKSLGAAVTVSVTVVLWVALGAVPVTVTEYGPGVVAGSTVNVSVELPPAVTTLGLKDAVVPEGSPPAESVTLSAEPLVRAVEIVDVALPPCTADTLLGFAPIEKSLGAAVTVSVTVVLWIALGAVPVTVTEYGPGVVAAPTLSVSVELPPAATDPGLKDADAPEGSPLAESVTVSADPLITAVEMVDVALPPWTADTLLGLALIEKLLGAAVTVSVTVVLCVALGAVPVTVTE